MAIEKGLFAVAAAVVGVAFVGTVGYKVIKKKNPDAFKGISKFMTEFKDAASEMVEGAAESFKEGYAQAS